MAKELYRVCEFTEELSDCARYSYACNHMNNMYKLSDAVNTPFDKRYNCMCALKSIPLSTAGFHARHSGIETLSTKKLSLHIMYKFLHDKYEGG